MNDAQVEEIKRHVGVVAEALRSDIRQVAKVIQVLGVSCRRYEMSSAMNSEKCAP